MNSMNAEQSLQDVYSVMAELWCSPPAEDGERDEIRKKGEKAVHALESIDQDSANLLSRFLGDNQIAEEDYIDLFELDPQCPLYLGSHTYEEPKTCATAAVSDRNDYMIELGGIYNHFGRTPSGAELPDYLPLMVDFLALTAPSRDDPVRDKLINDFILPFLAPMRARLEEIDTHYIHLLDALENVINSDLKISASSKQREKKVKAHVG